MTKGQYRRYKNRKLIQDALDMLSKVEQSRLDERLAFTVKLAWNALEIGLGYKEEK